MKHYEVRSVNTCNCMEITFTNTLSSANKIAEARRFWGHTAITINQVD